MNRKKRIVLDWNTLTDVLRKSEIVTNLIGTNDFDVEHHQEFTADLNGELESIGIAIEARNESAR